MNTGPTFDVFLSYNSLDHEAVTSVAEQLEARGCSYFIDRWYLKPGHDWVDALERALAASRSVAVFLGQHEMGRWQQRERTWALDRQAGDSEFAVVPVLLPGCEPPLGFLGQLTWIDLRNNHVDPQQMDALAGAIRGEKVEWEGLAKPRAMTCPYRGLKYFREEDAKFFFGRDDCTHELLSKIASSPIVAVVGASGSGKSSVVRAGLVPALRKKRAGCLWDVLTMFPKDRPVLELVRTILPLVEPDAKFDRAHDLAKKMMQGDTPLRDYVDNALRHQPGTDRLLLVVDQWEELYTQCKDKAQRQCFVQQLIEATDKSPLTIVLTLRSDFYTPFGDEPELQNRIKGSIVNVCRMTAEELRQVIAAPAKQVELTLESGLADLILKDLGDEPGRLPLLEFALEQLWNRREQGQVLTHKAYKALRGVGGAIATHAEDVVNKLTSQQQKLLPRIFRRLVTAGISGNQDTRRRVSVTSFSSDEQLVIQHLASQEARLLVTSVDEDSAKEMIDVAHEALFREWGELKAWVESDREFLLWRRKLAPLIETSTEDPKGTLLRGKSLRDARPFYASRTDELEQTERAFVSASLRAERRRNIQFWGGALVISCTVLILSLNIYSLIEQSNSLKVVQSFLRASPSEVESKLNELRRYDKHVVPLLHSSYADKSLTTTQHLHVAMALARFRQINDDELRFLINSVPGLSENESLNHARALNDVNRDSLEDEWNQSEVNKDIVASLLIAQTADVESRIRTHGSCVCFGTACRRELCRGSHPGMIQTDDGARHHRQAGDDG